MEIELFSWEDYKIGDNLKTVFIGCTLKQHLIINGQATGWPNGSKIKEIEVDYINGTIEFFDIDKDGSRIVLDSFLVTMALQRKI